VADAAPSLEDGAGAAAAMDGGAAEADATGLFARPAADATAGRFLIFLLAGVAGIA
jgi:hypothetical protein